ncbi:MAG: hypothetical protein F4Y80_09070 [Caldilineaceae bacterium SB0665_bin_21]|nr:hypothetical protein [Caldilineaceae bacterium SB0665_bin_21]
MRKIFEADTAIGRISAGYRWDVPSMRLLPPHPSDLRIQADIIISLEFSSGQSLESAISKARKVVKFLATISGSPITIVQAALSLAPASSSVLELVPPPYYVPVYENVPTDREIGPIVKDGATMARLITKWIGLGEGTEVDGRTQGARWEARNRYHTSCLLKGQVYDEDRLVSAANLFDLLPSSATQCDFELSPEALIAVDTARCIIKKMLKEDDAYHTRSRCLSDLARVKHPTLKNRVRARAKIVKEELVPQLNQIELITDRAVDLRNRYVHGVDSNVNPPLGLLVVCTVTLEFVFVVSELIEAGWDVSTAREFPRVQHMVNWYPHYYEAYFNEYCDVD